MFHSIYSSKESQEFSAADLKTLLMQARIRNREVGVTGILVYHAGCFLQVLEGEKAAVETILSRIENDPRHGELRILSRAASVGKRRLFGDWSMAFADTAGAANILKGFIDLKSGLNLSDLDKVQALNILKSCNQNSIPAVA
jgi:hypothetical protein